MYYSGAGLVVVPLVVAVVAGGLVDGGGIVVVVQLAFVYASLSECVVVVSLLAVL